MLLIYIISPDKLTSSLFKHPCVSNLSSSPHCRIKLFCRSCSHFQGAQGGEDEDPGGVNYDLSGSFYSDSNILFTFSENLLSGIF